MTAQVDLTRYAFRPSRLAEIVNAVLAGAGPDLEHATTLPPATYASQEFFDLEMDAIFRKDWVYIGHVAQLPNVGDYFSVDLLNEPLLAVRGEDRIRVLSRVCLHRWSALAQGAGNFAGKRIACPFHKWTYDLTGRLAGAPLMQKAADFNRANCRLPEIRSEIVHGMIFVTLSDSVDSIGERLADLAPRVQNFHLEKAKIAFSEQYVLDFNWKMSVETFAECYHHLGAHATTGEPFFPARLSWCESTRKGWTFCHNDPATDTRNADPTAAVVGADSAPAEFPDLDPEESGGVNLYVLYPANLLSLNRRRVNLISVLPVGPNRTIWNLIALAPDVAFEDPHFKDKVAKAQEMLNLINDEDMRINGLQQLGAGGTLASKGRLSHLESTVWDLANYVRGKIAAHIQA